LQLNVVGFILQPKLSIY